MGTLLIILLIISGLVLTISGIRENWPFRRDVTPPAEMIRLRELNDRIKRDMERTLAYSKNCFRTFGILARTKYRNLPDPFLVVMRDRDWRKVRNTVMSSARRGQRHCRDLLNISIEEPDVILRREAFAFCQECCRDCPLLAANTEQMNTCPIVQAIPSDKKENGQKAFH